MKNIITAIAAWSNQHPIQRKTLLIVAGAGAGYAYYYYIGCASGTCPITGNPYISTAYGAMMGLLIGYDRRNKNDKGCADGTC